MYCGNNADNQDLLSGQSQIGNRYGCLRKGIGKGLHLPTDRSYLGSYSPIDQRKVYCGQQDDLPGGYDLMGSLPNCLQKGIGIGKRKKAMESQFPGRGIGMAMESQFPGRGSPRHHRTLIMATTWILMASGTFTLLYLLQPSWVTITDPEGVTRLDLKKFIPIYIALCILLSIPFIILYNR